MIAYLLKGPQGDLFGSGVQNPGSRGGHFHVTETGRIDYGKEHPGKHLVGKDVAITDGEHAGLVGRVISAEPEQLGMFAQKGGGAVLHVRVSYDDQETGETVHKTVRVPMSRVKEQGRLFKATQYDLFGKPREVKEPGKLGGKFYTTETGKVRYGDKPAPAAPPAEDDHARALRDLRAYEDAQKRPPTPAPLPPDEQWRAERAAQKKRSEDAVAAANAKIAEARAAKTRAAAVEAAALERAEAKERADRVYAQREIRARGAGKKPLKNETRLVELDGMLFIRTVYDYGDEPTQRVLYYPIGARAGAFRANYGDRIGAVLKRADHITDDYMDEGGLRYRLIEGGKTKPDDRYTELRDIPPPKARGKELMFRQGRWHRYLKKDGWTIAYDHDPYEKEPDPTDNPYRDRWT